MSGPNVTTGNSHSNSITAQDQRALDALRSGPQSTLDLRSRHDILMPSGCIFRLRDRGFDIATVRSREQTDCGKLHTVARYILNRSPASETSF